MYCVMCSPLLLIALTVSTALGMDAPYKFGDRVLLKMQPSWRACYMQYQKSIDQLNVLLPYDLFERPSYPYCLCEVWWPKSKPTQVWLFEGSQNDATPWKDAGPPESHCVSQPGSSDCESFESNHMCQGRIWIGSETSINTRYLRERNKPLNEETILRCTKDSPAGVHSNPKYPVFVYDVDSFDIGLRCKKDKIIQILNDRLELYRQNSQFYLQIAMYFGIEGIDLSDACDSRILSEGFYLIVYFKCLPQLPDMEYHPTHINPVYRSVPSTEWLKPDDAVSCYYLLDISDCMSYDSISSCNEDMCWAGVDPSEDDNCIAIDPIIIPTEHYPPYEYCETVEGVLKFSEARRIRLSCPNKSHQVKGFCPEGGHKGCLYKEGHFLFGRRSNKVYEEVRWRGDSDAKYDESIKKMLCRDGSKWFDYELYKNRAKVFWTRINTEHYRSIPAIFPDDWSNICEGVWEEATCQDAFYDKFNDKSEQMWCKLQNFAVVYHYRCVPLLS